MAQAPDQLFNDAVSQTQPEITYEEMLQQTPVPRLEEALKFVAATTDEVISQRESVAELECRIDEGVYLLKGLMRVLRRAKAMVILMKPTVWPELNDYVHALESSVERESRYLSQLQDKWSHQTYIVLPHAEKLKRAAQRGLNEAANGEVLEVAASPKFVLPAPRVKKRVGRPATRRTVSEAKPPKNPARSGAISKRTSRRRSTAAAGAQGQKTVQQAAVAEEVIVVDDDDGLGFLPPLDPNLNFNDAFVAGEAAVFNNQATHLDNTATVPTVVPRADEAALQVDPSHLLPPSEFNVEDPANFIIQVPTAELVGTQVQDGTPIFNGAENELDALLNLTPPDANQNASAITPADLVAPPVVHAAFDESLQQLQEVHANEEVVETEEMDSRETPSVAHGASDESLQQQETHANEEEVETEEMKNLREMLEHSPEQMDIDELFNQTPVNVRELKSDLDGLNLDATLSDEGMFSSPVGSEPETMRGNFQGDEVFDDEHPVSPRIEDEKSPDRRWIPSSLFSDEIDWAELVPEAVLKAREHERYRETPGSPSMFEVLRTPSPRVKHEIDELWDMDSFNVKDVPFVEDWNHPDAREKVEVTVVEVKEELEDVSSEEETRYVKDEDEPQIVDLTEFEEHEEYEEIHYEPRRNKDEPAVTEVTEIEEFHEVEEEVIERKVGPPKRVPAKASGEDENSSCSGSHEEELKTAPKPVRKRKQKAVAARRKKELEIPSEDHEVPRLSKERSESAIDEKSEEEPPRKTKANVRKPKTRTAKKKKDKETNLEQKPKARAAKKQEDAEDVSRRPRTRAMKKREEMERADEQKPKTRAPGKEDTETFVEQKKPKTGRAKRDDVDALVEQKPKTRRVRKKSEEIEATGKPKPRGRRVKKKEDLEAVAEKKLKTRVAKKKVKGQAEADSAAAKPRTRVKKVETRADIPQKPSSKAQASVNRLYPKNNEVRFKYEPKKSRHDKAYEIAASAPEITQPARTPSSVNELYRTNSEVKFRYEPKPSRHDKACKPPTATRKAGRDKLDARKKPAQETIDRLFPKQADKEPSSVEAAANKPPRRSARLREQAEGLECEVADRAPLEEVAAGARKRKARGRGKRE